MVQATIFEAKSKLSELVRKARAGEEVVITSGKARVPVARIEPIVTPPKKRLGLLEKPGWDLPASFWEPMDEEELKLWEGEGD